MECGIGLCGHCQMGRYFVCRDGPVFSRARAGRACSSWRASDGAHGSAAAHGRRRQVRLLRRLPAGAARPGAAAARARHTLRASSSSARPAPAVRAGPYDVLLVEGSVSTPEHVEQIRELRAQDRAAGRPSGPAPRAAASRRCAAGRRTTASPPASIPRPGGDRARWPPPRPSPTTCVSTPSCAAAPSTAASCVELLTRRRHRSPAAAPRRGGLRGVQAAGRVCVVVARGEPCLGPITRTGCGAHLPGLRPWLLRLLRPARAGQRRGPGHGHGQRGLDDDDDRATARRLHRLDAARCAPRSPLRGGPPGFR